jgi:hypothetical protein
VRLFWPLELPKAGLGVLYDEVVTNITPGKHNFSFDGSELQPGTYLYRVETSDEYFTGKFMKSR